MISLTTVLQKEKGDDSHNNKSKDLEFFHSRELFHRNLTNCVHSIAPLALWPCPHLKRESWMQKQNVKCEHDYPAPLSTPIERK